VTVDVFLSVGRTSTDDQERLVASLEATLRSLEVAPRTVGRNDFSSKAPLKRIEEVLGECHGTVVLAFERSWAPSVTSRRGSVDQALLSEVRLPTVWNQIEAALSYGKGLPLLVIVETGLLPEGLLEARYDWYVQTIPMDVTALQTNEFRAVLADWIRQVEAHASRPAARASAEPDVSTMSLAQLAQSLTVAQAWSVLGAVATVLIAVAAVAYKLGGA